MRQQASRIREKQEEKKQAAERRRWGREKKRGAGTERRGKGSLQEEQPYPPGGEEKFHSCRYPYRRVWREETVG